MHAMVVHAKNKMADKMAAKMATARLITKIGADMDAKWTWMPPLPPHTLAHHHISKIRAKIAISVTA